MRKHVLMWWLAGGATLLGATLTYLTTRPAVAPVVSRAQAGFARFRESRAWETGARTTREVGERLRETLVAWLRKDRAERGDDVSSRPTVRSPAFEAYRAAELARLEEEERAFHAYLERLRTARDREEFESLMQDRRPR